MATAGQPQSPPVDSVSTDDPWREKYKRWWLQLRGLAWDAMNMDRIAKQNAIVRENARRAMGGTLGKPREGQAMEEDTAIRIGDEVHNHYAAPQQSSVPSWLKTAVAAAGLLGGGAAIPLAVDWLTTEPPEKPAESGLDPGGLQIEVVKDPETK